MKSKMTVRLKLIHSAALSAILTVLALPLWAESVDVKYRGQIDLKHFDCRDITRSSFIRRVCYDATNQYMPINLNGTYYHYCEIDRGTVLTLLGAESMGRYYNSYVKGRFDCRVKRIPTY